MPSPQCPVPSAQCPVLSAQCSVPSAQCRMANAFLFWGGAFPGPVLPPFTPNSPLRHFPSSGAGPIQAPSSHPSPRMLRQPSTRAPRAHPDHRSPSATSPPCHSATSRMEPGGIEPPSTCGISGRIRRFRTARSARRSAVRTGGQTGRRTGTNGGPDWGTSPAHVTAEHRRGPRPARRRPGPPSGVVGQLAPRRACRDRRGAQQRHACPLTPPDARQNRRNPRCRDAAGHRRPFRRRHRRHGSFPPGSPM